MANPAPATTATKPQTMDAKFVNAFLTGTMNTFKVQCSYELTPGKSFILPADSKIPMDIAGVIGLTSSVFCGAITIALPKTVFLACMGSMFGETYTEITDELADGAAELMNIIFGTAKTTLTNEGISMEKAIPTVIRGDNLRLTSVTGGGTTIAVPFNAKDGTFHVLISLGKAKAELKAVK